jgi:uncharacterized membrane protein
MAVYISALLIGVIAGLRTMMAPTAVSWAVYLGWLPVSGSWAAFMGFAYTPYIFTLFAVGELIVDKLPTTPSRKMPLGFGARIVSGGFSGAVIGTVAGSPIGGLIAGAIGAVIGTLGGAAVRATLAKNIGRDWPAALIEDAVAILGGFLIVFPDL